MKRKGWLLALSLLFLLAAHLHPVYRVSVAGRNLEGVYSPAQLREGREAAQRAAEEILTKGAALPAARCQLRLRLRPADGSSAILSDALLRATQGISLADGVRVNGTALGTVADGQALLEQLRESIRREMPEGAAVGTLGGSLQIRPVYTRSGRESGNWDIILRITAMAPVFYLDESGKVV